MADHTPKRKRVDEGDAAETPGWFGRLFPTTSKKKARRDASVEETTHSSRQLPRLDHLSTSSSEKVVAIGANGGSISSTPSQQRGLTTSWTSPRFATSDSMPPPRPVLGATASENQSVPTALPRGGEQEQLFSIGVSDPKLSLTKRSRSMARRVYKPSSLILINQSDDIAEILKPASAQIPKPFDKERLKQLFAKSSVGTVATRKPPRKVWKQQLYGNGHSTASRLTSAPPKTVPMATTTKGFGDESSNKSVSFGRQATASSKPSNSRLRRRVATPAGARETAPSNAGASAVSSNRGELAASSTSRLLSPSSSREESLLVAPPTYGEFLHVPSGTVRLQGSNFTTQDILPTFVAHNHQGRKKAVGTADKGPTAKTETGTLSSSKPRAPGGQTGWSISMFKNMIGKWQCPQCSLYVKDEKEKCDSCETAKPSDSSSFAIGSNSSLKGAPSNASKGISGGTASAKKTSAEDEHTKESDTNKKFRFGIDSTSPSNGVSETTPSTTGGFSFGVPPTEKPSGMAAGGIKGTKSMSETSNSRQNTKGFSFGVTAASEKKDSTPKPNGFQFSKSSETKPASETARPQFSFGAPPQATGGFKFAAGANQRVGDNTSLDTERSPKKRTRLPINGKANGSPGSQGTENPQPIAKASLKAPPSNRSIDAENSRASAESVSKPSSFVFGTSSGSVVAPSPAGKPAFSFGSTETTSLTASKPIEPSSSGFTFGAKESGITTSMPSKAESSSFVFGKSNSTAPTPAPTPAPTGPPSTANPFNGSFSFGSNSSAPAPSTNPHPVAFGASATSSQLAVDKSSGSSNGGNNAQTMTFGSSSSKSSTAPAASTSVVPPASGASSGFTFGTSSSVSAVSGPFVGSTSSTTNTPSFGATNAPPPVGAFGSQGQSFGTAASGGHAFGQSMTTSPAIPMFGAPATTTAPGPAFGQGAVPGTSFGSSATGAAPFSVPGATSRTSSSFFGGSAPGMAAFPTGPGPSGFGVSGPTAGPAPSGFGAPGSSAGFGSSGGAPMFNIGASDSNKRRPGIKGRRYVRAKRPPGTK